MTKPAGSLLLAFRRSLAQDQAWSSVITGLCAMVYAWLPLHGSDMAVTPTRSAP